MTPLVPEGLVVQWPDTHVPDHHRGAVRSMIRFITAVKPALVLMTGDFFDVKSLARWSEGTVEENGRGLKQEIDQGRRVLGDLRDVYQGRMAWLPGNHEARLVKWGRTRGRGAFGLDCLTIPALAGFEDLAIETPGGLFEESTPVAVAPGVLAIHGTAVRKLAGYTVHAEMEKFGTSVVMGHTHRLALVHRADATRARFGVEAGHLMDQKRADYLRYGTADWQMGFAVLDVKKTGVSPAVVAMKGDGAFWWGGVKW